MMRKLIGGLAAGLMTAVTVAAAAGAQTAQTAQTAKTAQTAQTAKSSPEVFRAAGRDAAAIRATVDAYRNELGTLNANEPGSRGSGRRQIDWDGVPDAFSSPNEFPGDFFNGPQTGRARGVVFSTPGSGFEVSANAGVAPIEFDNLQPGSSRRFGVFSPQRLFTAVGSTVTEVRFFEPGTDKPATVSGFGAVFTDVDHSNRIVRRPSTTIEYFGASGKLLLKRAVPSFRGQETLSFLGVSYGNRRPVAKVRITSGSRRLGRSEGRFGDLVVMDDFIFGEPVKR